VNNRKTSTKPEKKLAEDARLLRAWRRWHEEELEAALAGPHGELGTQLVGILRGLNLQSAPALLEFVHAHDWEAIDRDTRLVMLHEISSAITKLRTCRHGAVRRPARWPERLPDH
jgi:hypothetical protein